MYFDKGPGLIVDECYAFTLGGDTTLNDTAYKILRRSGVYNWYLVAPPYFSTVNHYAGAVAAFLREDTLDRRVFVRMSAWQQEELMFDFSVGLGAYPSTFPIPFGADVILIDSVLYNDGYHRRLNLDQNQDQEPDLAVIEGIGATVGFQLWLGTSTWHAGGLVCHLQNGISDYEFLWSSSCACGSIVSVPMYTDGRIKAGPNPASEAVHVVGALPNAVFVLRSVDGRAIQSGVCSSDGKATIGLSGLRAAVYILELYGETVPEIVRVVKQ